MEDFNFKDSMALLERFHNCELQGQSTQNEQFQGKYTKIFATQAENAEKSQPSLEKVPIFLMRLLEHRK